MVMVTVIKKVFAERKMQGEKMNKNCPFCGSSRIEELEDEIAGIVYIFCFDCEEQWESDAPEEGKEVYPKCRLI